MTVTSNNLNSTKEDIVAALAEEGMHIYARYGAVMKEIRQYMNRALNVRTKIMINDGGYIAELLHTEYQELLPEVEELHELE